MIQYKCDRCGREIHAISRNNYRDGVVRFNVEFKLDTPDQYDDRLDLCPRCTNELDLFLGGHPLSPGLPGDTCLRTYSEKIRISISKGEL